MNPIVKTHAENIIKIIKNPIVIDGVIAYGAPFKDFFRISNTRDYEFSYYSCTIQNFEMAVNIVEEIANIFESPLFDRTIKEQEFKNDPNYLEIDFEKPIYLHYWKVIVADEKL